MNVIENRHWKPFQSCVENIVRFSPHVKPMRPACVTPSHVHNATLSLALCQRHDDTSELH